MSLYNAKRTTEGIRITKFTDDLDVEETQGKPSSYIVSRSGCGCPAGHRDTCRHREMLPTFENTKRINTRWFYDFDNNIWYYNSDEGLTQEPFFQHRMALRQRAAWRRI